VRGTALLLVMVLVPASAAAQGVATSFAELNRHQALDEGDELRITCDLSGDGEYEEMTAEFVSLTDTAITVIVESPPSRTELTLNQTRLGWQVRIPESQVSRVEVQPSDPIWNGLIIGAAVGAGVGLAAGNVYCKDAPTEWCAEEEGHQLPGLLFGGIGAGIGAGIDAMHKLGLGLVYRSPGATQSSFTFSLSPMVSKKRKGVLFTVTW